MDRFKTMMATVCGVLGPTIAKGTTYGAIGGASVAGIALAQPDPSKLESRDMLIYIIVATVGPMVVQLAREVLERVFPKKKE